MFWKTWDVSHRNGKKCVLSVALATSVMLTSGFTMDNIQPVRILVDGHTIETHTASTDPERMLDYAGVQLGTQDEYCMKKVGRKTEITVYRALPITIEYKGTRKEVLTTKETVGEALSDLGYNITDYEALPGFDARIQENLRIELKDSAAAKAAEAARQAEIARQVELERQRQQMVQTSRGDARYTAVMTMEATAYLPTEGSAEGLTATGIEARYGIVAVDPDVIPLGTRLFIPGYGEALAADTGGAIQGNKIDLCMESYGEAIEFGRRTVTVYVLK